VSRTGRTFFVAYTLLVGLPLLGLIGVLKIGRSLKAPISVDGVWTFQINSASLCMGSQSEFEPVMLISQSGPYLQLRSQGAPTLSGSGVIDGKKLRAILPGSSADANGCGTNRGLSLVANVDPDSQPRQLNGSIQFADCRACSPIAFRALKQPTPAGPH